MLIHTRALLLSGLALGALTAAAPAQAFTFTAGDLVVSSSTYTGTASTVTVGQTTPGSGTKTAVADGTFPTVFNNSTIDGSFGVSSPLFLNQYNIGGTEAAPTISANGVYNVTAATGVATSFASKSEGALNLSPDGHTLSFVDYYTAPNVLDVSNSNTPGIVEPGNYTANPTARTVVNLDNNANAQVLQTNAYPGNNGRAAIDVNGTIYLAGNSGNASGSAAVTGAGGIQSFTPASATTTAGAYNTTRVESYNITQNGYAADKTAKDNNFRGLTVFNNTLYTTKGSGGNGIDTVYQVGTAGTLPGSTNTAINILPGFPTGLATTNTAGFYPFGLFFANATTLYVADEGSGSAADYGTSKTNGGLSKWSLVGGVWVEDYVLSTGLNVGLSYAVCPVGTTTCTASTSAPTTTNYTAATDGLRNITGVVNADGTVTIYGITSTTSLSGDQGADPNELVAITDSLANTSSTVASTESFTTLQTAAYGQVLRGVSFAPVPEPASMTVFGLGTAVLGFVRRRRNNKR